MTRQPAIAVRSSSRDVSRDVDRIVAENRGAQLERRVALERPRAGGHLVQHDAERPDVAGHLHVLAAQLLGRHVRQRADGRPGLRERGMHLGDGGRHVRVHGALRETEVQNLHATVRRDDDVVALQIAMDDAALVGMRECVRELTSVVHDLLGRQRARRCSIALSVCPSTSSIAM